MISAAEVVRKLGHDYVGIVTEPVGDSLFGASDHWPPAMRTPALAPMRVAPAAIMAAAS